MIDMKQIPEWNCEEIQGKLQSYMNEHVRDIESREIEEHLKVCKVCAKRLEEEENKVFLQENVKHDLPDARRIESRLSWKIARRALTIIGLIIFVFYAVFGFILPLAFNKVNVAKSHDLNYALKDIIQFGIPGSHLKGGYEGTATLFDMVINIEYEQKTVGGGLKTGVFNLAVPLYTGRNGWKISSINNRQGMGYVFPYPQMRGSSSLGTVWEKLDKIGGGTRTIAAIYFEEPVNTSEMKRILDKIQSSDQNTWLALETGDAVKWEYDTGKLYRELGMFSPQWGFPMSMNLTPAIADSITRDSKGNVTGMSGGHKEHDVMAVGENFKKEMKALEGYSEKYFEAPEFTGDLKSLNKFIALHGIQLRGAIVEASTVNILKLKDELNIARIDVVDVRFDY